MRLLSSDRDFTAFLEQVNVRDIAHEGYSTATPNEWLFWNSRPVTFRQRAGH